MREWTPGRLVRYRIANYIKEQIRVWRTALDWTVWVYLLVPGLLIGGGTYRDLWRDPPAWLIDLPTELALIPLTVYLLLGRLRTWLEDADAVFMLQRTAWTSRLIYGGALYTMAVQTLGTALLFGLLLPWLRLGGGFGWSYLALWALYTLGCKSFFTVLKRVVEARWRGWRRWLFETLIIIGVVAAYVLPIVRDADAALLASCTVLAFGAWSLAFAAKLRQRGSFETDIREERSARLASTGLLLTPVMEQKPTVQLKKPVVFRRSGRLLRNSDAGTMLAEMRLKSFLRKLGNVQLWFGFISASTMAIFLSPSWLGLGLAAVLPLLAASWVHGQWKEWADEPFIAQFRWEEKALRRGSALSRFWIIMPAALWLSAIAGAMTAGWIGALIGLPIGLGVWYTANGAMAEFFAPVKQKPAARGN